MLQSAESQKGSVEMSKFKLAAVIALILFLSSCSVQERTNPEIIKSRIENSYPEFVFENDGYYLNDYYYAFAGYKNCDIAFKIRTNENNVANKISISFEINENISEIAEVIRPVIEIFSPNEDCDKIVNELIDTEKAFSYSYGKEYSYSLAVNEKNVYFEVFNNRLAEYSVPDLTLKENDRITF